MSTTRQTVTLAGEDYVVIRRAEHERPRAAADEDATDAPRHPRFAEGEHSKRGGRTHRCGGRAVLLVAGDAGEGGGQPLGRAGIATTRCRIPRRSRKPESASR